MYYGISLIMLETLNRKHVIRFSINFCGVIFNKDSFYYMLSLSLFPQNRENIKGPQLGVDF